MSSRIDIAKRELEVMNPLQRFMSNTQEQNEDSIIDTMLNDEGFHTISRFITFRQKMENRSVGEENEFPVPIGIHQLNLSTFCQKLPKVMLNKEYQDDHRIAWIPKTLLYLIASAQLVKSDGTEIGSQLTGSIFDIWIEYHTKEFFKTDYETLIDMIQGDTQWNSVLEEKILSLPQPFFYATARSFLKRCLIDRQNIFHRYLCRRDVRNLLMMERRIDNVWTPCSSDEIFEKCRFANLTADGILPYQAELWGTGLITNDREYKETMEILLTQNYLTPAQELIYVSVDKILEKNGTETVALEYSGCVRGIYWMIQNLNADERGDHFNYATEEGNSPILTTSLYYLDTHVWTVESHHHRKLVPAEAGLRVPLRMGYHYQSFSALGSLKNTDTSIDLLEMKSRLTVKYDLGRKTKGRLHIFLDMHRVVSYENGDIRVLKNESPVNIVPMPQQQPQPIPQRQEVVRPSRHGRN